MSMLKCSASASRAWLWVCRATRPSARDRTKSTAIESRSTANGQIDRRNGGAWPTIRSAASARIHNTEATISSVSVNAARFSILPWPYAWASSAGRSETVTEARMMIEATRSRPECAASDNIPILPLTTPAHSFRSAMMAAANTEMAAVRLFVAGFKVLRS